MNAGSLLAFFASRRWPLSDEKRLQLEIAEAFDESGIDYRREVRLSEHDIIDFVCVDAIGIEIKVKGSKRSIYHQVERYAAHDELQELILVSNVAMGFPPEIKGKPVFFHNLAKAWL